MIMYLSSAERDPVSLVLSTQVQQRSGNVNAILANPINLTFTAFNRVSQHWRLLNSCDVTDHVMCLFRVRLTTSLACSGISLLGKVWPRNQCSKQFVFHSILKLQFLSVILGVHFLCVTFIYKLLLINLDLCNVDFCRARIIACAVHIMLVYGLSDSLKSPQADNQWSYIQQFN